MEQRAQHLKLRCEKCNNEQIIFERAATKISCLVCGEVLATPTGGRANILGRVLEILK